VLRRPPLGGTSGRCGLRADPAILFRVLDGKEAAIPGRVVTGGGDGVCGIKTKSDGICETRRRYVRFFFFFFFLETQFHCLDERQYLAVTENSLDLFGSPNSGRRRGERYNELFFFDSFFNLLHVSNLWTRTPAEFGTHAA